MRGPYADAEEGFRLLGEVKRLAEERGVRLTFVVPPIYLGENDSGAQGRVDLLQALSGVIDFWDFTDTPYSRDPRFFYEPTRFRSALGDMMLAVMWGDGEAWVPDGFGRYVTATTEIDCVPVGAKAVLAQEVPILMYHHLAEQGDPSLVITPARFAEHMEALSESGCTPVPLSDLLCFVDHGIPLPEKPVCITFDDGYLSNYEYAYPVLRRKAIPATIFIIGATVGATTEYKDTGFLITPHFSWEEAREMLDSGLISIESHTFDMHQRADYDGEGARESVLSLPGESERDYISALKSDFVCMKEVMLREIGHPIEILSYPGGRYDLLAQTVFRDMGARMTLGVEPGLNELVAGLPQCLYGLHRYNASGATVHQLLEWCVRR